MNFVGKFKSKISLNIQRLAESEGDVPNDNGSPEDTQGDNASLSFRSMLS